MLRYLVIVIFITASRSLECISDFSDAEEAILNGTLGSGEVLSNISIAFFPTSGKEAEYLVVRYFYALNNTKGELNHSLETDYIWARSSVYLVVEPNALEDLTCGLVDVPRRNLSINLQCLCPSYPNDATAIIRRLTAYLRCYARINTKPLSDDDDECKINSFIRRYDPHDSLYEKVVDVMNTIKVVSWLSLVLMLFLQLELLNTLYTVILKNHKKYKIMKIKKIKRPQEPKVKDYLLKKKQNKEKDKKSKNELTHYFPIAWATIYIASVLFVVILLRDTDSELADCNSVTEHDYKELYIGVYSTWLVGIVVAIYFPKCTSFPVPVVTGLFERLDMKESRLFHVLTFTIQSLAICIWFCLIQLLTLHFIFWLVALLAKPVGLLVTLGFLSTLIGSAIAGTSVVLEILSLERINPWGNTSKNPTKFRLYNYLKDLPNFIGSALLSIFLLALMFLVYQFGDKLESTLDFSGAPAAIAGTIQSIFFFLVSVALRQKSFRDIFKKRDYEEEEKKDHKKSEPHEGLVAHEGLEADEGLEDYVEPEYREGSSDKNTRPRQDPMYRKTGPRLRLFSRVAKSTNFWPHKFLYPDDIDGVDDDDDDDDNDYTINGK